MDYITDMTRYPLAVKLNICLKKISAVPLTGGKHINGHLIVFGPESYILQP